MIQSRRVIWKNSIMKFFWFELYFFSVTRRKNGYRYFIYNIVLTEIKIHNMHCSLAFPLDSIRKLLCGNVKDTLTSNQESLGRASILYSLKENISKRKYKKSQRKSSVNFKAELNGWKWVGVKLLNFFHFLCSKIKAKISPSVIKRPKVSFESNV